MVKAAGPLSGDLFDSSYYCNRYCNQILPVFSEICCLFPLRRDGERIGEDILQRITADFRCRAEVDSPISTTPDQAVSGLVYLRCACLLQYYCNCSFPKDSARGGKRRGFHRAVLTTFRHRSGKWDLNAMDFAIF